MAAKRALALAVAFLTLAPWVYFILFVAYLMPHLTILPGSELIPEEFTSTFNTMLRLHIGVMLLCLALVIGYIVHLFRTHRVPAERKALWAVMLLIGNLLAMPVYWYLYVWPRARATPP